MEFLAKHWKLVAGYFAIGAIVTTYAKLTLSQGTNAAQDAETTLLGSAAGFALAIPLWPLTVYTMLSTATGNPVLDSSGNTLGYSSSAPSGS